MDFEKDEILHPKIAKSDLYLFVCMDYVYVYIGKALLSPPSFSYHSIPI